MNVDGLLTAKDRQIADLINQAHATRHIQGQLLDVLNVLPENVHEWWQYEWLSRVVRSLKPLLFHTFP
jgi:hypothetical protein